MASSTRPRLLGVGFAAEGFGYGRVFRSLYERLGGRWEIEHLEFSPPGSQSEQAAWRVHHTRRPAVYLGHLEFAEIVERRAPDLIFFLADLWHIPPYLRALDGAARMPRIVVYTPVDGRLTAGPELRDLGRLDRLVVPTNFGRDEVMANLMRLGVPEAVPVDVIPHGLDSGRFYPYRDENGKTSRQRAREELFPEQPELSDAFIVLNANRNQSRKRLDLTLEGFALFAANKPANVKLYLHAGTIDEGINFVAYAERLGLLDRILQTNNSRGHPVVSDAELNRIFNACEVGINTSSGEGWGLVAFEHAATRAAQILARHSACAELWDGSASLLPAVPLESRGGWLQGSITSPESVAEALEKLYSDRAYLQQQADAAFNNAHREDLRWDAVARRFEELFLEVLETVTV